MGAITFEQAGTAIPGCASIATHPSGASATVTCQTVFAGSASTLSAVFTPTPAAQVTGSDSTAVGFVLGRAATTATMTLPAQVTLGKRLTLTAQGRPAGGHHRRLTDRRRRLPGRHEGDQGLRAGAGRRDRPLRGEATRRSAATRSPPSTSATATSPAPAPRVHKLAVVVPKPTGYRQLADDLDVPVQAALHPGGDARGDRRAARADDLGRVLGQRLPPARATSTRSRARPAASTARARTSTSPSASLGRKLGVGATLTVRLTHPGWLGKYYSFVVRHGRKPKIDTACLAVGQAKPGAGCTPR